MSQSPYDFGFGIDWTDACVYRREGYSTSVTDGKLRCNLWPYVIDVSLVGLKNPDDILKALRGESVGTIITAE